MNFFRLDNQYSLNVLYTILIIAIVYIIAVVLRRVINKKVSNLKVRHRSRKMIFYFAVVVMVLGWLEIWTTSLPSFTTIFSFVGAGLALTLHEAVLCLAGWMLIQIRKPFQVGERIEVESIKGDVIDIGLFQTFLIEVGNWVDADQSTGRIISMPNSVVFRHSLVNYNKEFPYIWNEIPILVTFESNWEKAREVILRCSGENVEEIQSRMKSLIDKMSRHYMIHYRKFTPTVYTKIEKSGVLLTLRYLTDSKQRRTSEDIIMQGILKCFAEHDDISFAYPTTRFYSATE